MQLTSRRTAESDAASPGRTGLYDLPPELLDWVVSYADAVDLLNLSLVCKSINKLVTSRLYSEYINTNLQYRRPLSKFLLKVAHTPDIAHHVRHVELGVWNTKLVFLHPGFRRDVQSLPDDVFEPLVDAAKETGLIQQDQTCAELRPIKKSNDLWCEFGPSYDSDGYDSDHLNELDTDFDSDRSTPPPRPRPHDDVEFLRCLKRGLEDPQVILLLAKLPRLQSLSLRGPHMSQGLPWEKLCSQSLRSLTKLKLAGNSGDSTWDIAELNTIIRLPSLRELHGYMATSDEWDDVVSKTLQIEPGSLSLTHIYLERCALGNSTIKRLVEGCKALEAFSYVAGGRYVGYEQFRARDVKEHLLKHKTTLKYLALDLSHWDFPRAFKSFRSMADFTSLEKVIIDYGTLRWRPYHSFAPIAMIQDDSDDSDDDDDGDVHAANTQPPLPDLLPPSIKDLVIFQAPPVIVENLLAFSTTPRAQHPHLRSIKIHTSRRRLATTPDHSRLPQIFHEKDIAYEEPAIDLSFPIPQMHAWIMDPAVRRMTRWSPRDGRYHGFSTRMGYRRFCEDELGERPAADGGPLDPSMNFAYGFEDDLISYLDERFESDMDDELESALGGAGVGVGGEMDEVDRLLAHHHQAMDMWMPGVPGDEDLGFEDEMTDEEDEGGSYLDGLGVSDVDDEEEEDDEDEDDDDESRFGEEGDIEAALGPMAYYEWDYYC